MYTESKDAKPERPKLRLPVMANEGGVGGVYLGDLCHGGVLTQVYADFDSEGHLVELHSYDIGSC